MKSARGVKNVYSQQGRRIVKRRRIAKPVQPMRYERIGNQNLAKGG